MTILKVAKRSSDRRSDSDIWTHYTIERELADRLRNANKQERRHLYTSLYNEICERVDIPLWNDPAPVEVRQRNLADKVAFLRRFVRPDSTFLEIGPGDCSVSIAIAPHVKQVYAVDVSTAITRNRSFPANVEVRISDGCSMETPDNSVDVAYSNQLMEHLHPDDALEQLQNVFRTLKPGGVYICITPSKLSGPHDVSKYFDETPTGFHLREYSTTELARIFRNAGFSRVRPFVWFKGKLCVCPLTPVKVLEAVLGILPGRLRRYIANRFPVSRILGRVVAYKPMN